MFAKIILFSVTGVLAVFIPVYFSILNPDWHHDGIVFTPAADVAAGLTLYKETYFQYGALTAYLHAIAIELFGKFLVVVRLEGAIFQIGIAFLMFLLARKISNAVVSSIVLIIWLALSPYFASALVAWSSGYALFFTALSGVLLIHAFTPATATGRSYWLCFLTGISISLAFWARQPFGVLFPTVLLTFLIFSFDKEFDRKRLFKCAVLYCCGFLIVSAIFIASFVLTRSLHDWWAQSIIGAADFVTDFSNQDNSFFENFKNKLFPWHPRANRVVGLVGGGPVWALLPMFNLLIFLTLTTFLLVRRTITPANRALIIVSVLGIGTWNQYFPHSGDSHVYWGASLMLVTVIPSFIRVFAVSIPSAIVAATASALVLGFLFAPDISKRVSFALAAVPHSKIEIPTLKGMWATERMAALNRFPGNSDEYALELKHLGTLLKNINQLDPEKALVTLDADLLLESNLAAKNPGPMSVGWYSVSRLYPDYKQKMRQFIQTEKPIIEINESRHPPYRDIVWNSQDPHHIALREHFGLGEYEELAHARYTDAPGISYFIAPRVFVSKYHKVFGGEE